MRVVWGPDRSGKGAVGARGEGGACVWLFRGCDLLWVSITRACEVEHVKGSH